MKSTFVALNLSLFNKQTTITLYNINDPSEELLNEFFNVYYEMNKDYTSIDSTIKFKGNHSTIYVIRYFASRLITISIETDLIFFNEDAYSEEVDEDEDDF